jgi:hypothetical protein
MVPRIGIRTFSGLQSVRFKCSVSVETFVFYHREAKYWEAPDPLLSNYARQLPILNLQSSADEVQPY